MIDDLIVAAVRLCLRQFRIQRAKRWHPAVATTVRGVAVQEHGEWYPVFFYTFTVDAREYLGNVAGLPGGEAEARQAISVAGQGKQVSVRFNPKDPDRNTALNDDNGEGLPFRIAE